MINLKRCSYGQQLIEARRLAATPEPPRRLRRVLEHLAVGTRSIRREGRHPACRVPKNAGPQPQIARDPKPSVVSVIASAARASSDARRLIQQEAERLVPVAPDAAAQLVELRRPKRSACSTIITLASARRRRPRRRSRHEQLQFASGNAFMTRSFASAFSRPCKARQEILPGRGDPPSASPP